MEAIRLHKIVEKDGEVSVSGLPCKKGQHVEMIVLIDPNGETESANFTAKQLGESELVGLWKDREDIKDSLTFAQSLRDLSQNR